MSDLLTQERTKKKTRSPREAAAILMKVNDSLRDKVTKMEDYIQSLQSELSVRNSEIEELQNEMKMAIMHVSGLESEIKAFHDEHPDSVLLQNSEYYFPDGRSKTCARITYEQAFDEEGRQLGIESPEEMR